MILTIEELKKACGGVTTEGTDDRSIINGVITDSREACDNKLFIAVRGEKTDGHKFVGEVLEKGCVALIENKDYFFVRTILTDNTKKAIQKISEWYRLNKLSKTRIVAVTGSVGKTTTKDMIALALGSGFKVSKTQGNKNSQLGLPLSVLETESDTEAAVLELGISEPDEMTHLSFSCRPDIAVITNIGYSHIEALGSRENIAKEKLAVADYLNENGILLLNGDEPLLTNDTTYKCQKFFCSPDNKQCDCFATDINENGDTTHFTAHIFGKSVSVKINALGKHNVSNALFALASAKLLGVDIFRAAKALENFSTTGLRQKIYTKDGYTIIADCYNASPESMAAALSVLGERSGRKIAVLGDMLELGDYAPMLHEKVGQAVLKNKADILIIFGTLAKNIATPVKGKIPVYSFEQDEYGKAANLLKEILKDGDTVLYKASNRMQLQKIIELV